MQRPTTIRTSDLNYGPFKAHRHSPTSDLTMPLPSKIISTQFISNREIKCVLRHTQRQVITPTHKLITSALWGESFQKQTICHSK